MGFRSDARAWLQGAMGKDLNQVVLAKRSGVSRGTINDILGEKRDADDDTLKRLARALQVPTPRVERVFLTDEGEAPSPVTLAMTLLRDEIRPRVLAAVDAALAPTGPVSKGKKPGASGGTSGEELADLARKEFEAAIGLPPSPPQPDAAPPKRRRGSHQE